MAERISKKQVGNEVRLGETRGWCAEVRLLSGIARYTQQAVVCSQRWAAVSFLILRWLDPSIATGISLRDPEASEATEHAPQFDENE